MWKRDESPRPQNGRDEFQLGAPATGPAVVPPRPAPVAQQRLENADVVNIGKSVVVKGELTGREDLMIDGEVEGKIELRDHALTIGSNGKIRAQIFAKSVTVFGAVTGNITASDKIDIRETGSVDGDIAGARIAMAEGAHFHGRVDMTPAKAAAKPADARAEQKPEGPAKVAPGPTPMRDMPQPRPVAV